MLYIHHFVVGMRTANITTSSDSTLPPCYFTYDPPALYYNHFRSETPLSSPNFTPIERRDSQSSTKSMASNFLQLQTAAAHSHPARPRPVPQQNVLEVTSDDSINSADSSSSAESFCAPETARCSRCQRTPSIDIKTGKSNMISYGLNLYYCSRCASMVGLHNR